MAYSARETSARDSNRALTGAEPERSLLPADLVNPFDQVRIFSDDEMESMHLAALRASYSSARASRVLSPRGRATLGRGRRGLGHGASNAVW